MGDLFGYGVVSAFLMLLIWLLVEQTHWAGQVPGYWYVNVWIVNMVFDVIKRWYRDRAAAYVNEQLRKRYGTREK